MLFTTSGNLRKSEFNVTPVSIKMYETAVSNLSLTIYVLNPDRVKQDTIEISVRDCSLSLYTQFLTLKLN